jgi:hypothetical protein
MPPAKRLEPEITSSRATARCRGVETPLLGSWLTWISVPPGRGACNAAASACGASEDSNTMSATGNSSPATTTCVAFACRAVCNGRSCRSVTVTDSAPRVPASAITSKPIGQHGLDSFGAGLLSAGEQLSGYSARGSPQSLLANGDQGYSGHFSEPGRMSLVDSRSLEGGAVRISEVFARQGPYGVVAFRACPSGETDQAVHVE